MKDMAVQFNSIDFLQAQFSTSMQTAELVRKLKRYLGFETNCELARLAIGISLGQETFPADMEAGSTLSMRGETLFTKEDYPLWLGLVITNYFKFHDIEQEVININRLQQIIKLHWIRGIKILWNIWADSEDDEEKFWRTILRSYSGLPDRAPSVGEVKKGIKKVTSSGAIHIVLGEILKGAKAQGEMFDHILNGSGYAPHVAIMGQAGSGKTRVLKSLLRQIKKQVACPVVLLDLGKGDLAKEADLISQLGAEVIQVPERPIPLDMFYVEKLGENSETTSAMENFRDAFSQVVSGKLGAKQSDNIREALLPLFQGKRKVTFSDIKETIEQFYEENSLSKDSVVSTINNLTLRELFVPTFSPEEFFDRSWVITFANARNEIKMFSACLLLSALDFYLKRQEEAPLDENRNRSLRLVVAIDEARELLNMNHEGLGSNIRLHRSKGLSVVLVSQSPDDYDGKKDDYLENIGLPICLKTNATSPKTLKNMFKGDVNFAALHPFECYTVNAVESKPILVKLNFPE